MEGEKKRELVYCGNCKYFVDGDIYVDECKHPNNIKCVHMYKGIKCYSIKSPLSINRDNDCEWYKPKWYVKLFGGRECKNFSFRRKRGDYE